FPGGFTPEYAITSNGANLLVNGIPDKPWHEEISDNIAACAAEFAALEEYLKSCPEVYFDIRIVDSAFLFTKCRNANEIITRASREISPALTKLFSCGDKLYSLPRVLGKETALARLRERFPNEKIIAAGDSLFDEGMLRAADMAIVKSGELSSKILNSNQFTEEFDDPDFALKTALQQAETESR
ncbi:MAG: HAD family hydrolase, partial [Oscillospiraceae bacterium]|nr:HAD family hydrolase [Oscillospiraceae bacterium]